MTFMTWTDNFLTGFDLVDQQHRKLVDMINEAAPVLAGNKVCDKGQAHHLLDNLIKYAGQHFATEEGIMLSHGIDKRHLEHHRVSHGTFAEQVVNMRRQFDDGGGLNGNDLLRFLSNWLAFHILGEDQRMAREIRAIVSGLSPTEAYDQTEGTKSEILRGANDVLVRALVDLFTQMTEQNRQLGEKNARIEAAHQELDSYRKNLEQQVASRTADLHRVNMELTRAKDAAENASQAKSRFLGIMSHELLTPLNAILGFAHLLERSDLPPKPHSQAERILKAGNQLHSLLSEVLQFLRLEAGEISTATAPFLLEKMVSQIANELGSQLVEKALELRIDIDSDIPSIFGDELHLKQALEILVANAIKFTEHGWIKISAKLLQKRVDQILVAIEVEDTGIGIPEERQKELFQVFEQLDSATTRTHGGIGIGLMVCSRLVSLMKGEINVESSHGKGSVFRITFWFGIDQGKPSGQVQNLSDKTPGMNKVKVNEAMQRLKYLLEGDDLEARKLFNELSPHLHNHLKKEVMAELENFINNYEFDHAVVCLQTLEISRMGNA